MMTGKVRAACATCGPVEVRAADVAVYSRTDTLQSVYRFQCPRCGDWTANEAGPSVAKLLLRAGAHVARWPQPSTRQRPPAALGPIRIDELDEFHEALERWHAAGGEFHDAVEPWRSAGDEPSN